MKQIADYKEAEAAAAQQFEAHATYNILSPFQVGILAAAQLPLCSVEQLLRDGVDPYLRLHTYFELGVV